MMKKLILPITLIVIAIALSGCIGECSENANCNDNNPCTIDSCDGFPAECNNVAVSECQTGDNCCPSACSYSNDKDCPTPSCNDDNPYTEDRFNETSQQCVNEKILFSKTLEPTSVLCGVKERNVTPKNIWIGTPIDCSDKLLEKDSDFYTIKGEDIELNKTPAIELKFDLTDDEIKEIVEAKTEIDMVCKFSLSIYTLTEFDEWKPTPDFYFHCEQWTKSRKVAEIQPQIINNIAYVLITPGTGDSEGDIDYAALEVSFYKT